jgi:predicted dehydrogenase
VDDLLTEDVDGLVIATRHDSHAELVMKALRAGKSVFCEKPLALTHSEIDEVEEALGGAQQRHEPPSLMVGFNRRFSPLVIRMKELISAVSAPMAVVVTVNAGALPPDHWAHDPSVGGGRILGEGCHFIDLIRHLCGSRIEVYSRSTLASGGGDTATIDLTLESGSIGTLHYWANGNSGYPKERVEVFVAGRVLQLDNFRTLRGFGWPGFKRLRLAKQDKGQSACIAAWLASLRDGRAPIDMIEMLEVSRVAVSLARPVPTEAS